MPTVVTRTIGVGKDYANFTTAEADVENIATSAFGGVDLVANDGAIVFEADAGTYSESVTFQSSLTTDATRNVTYKPAAGSEHGGGGVGGPIIYYGTATATVSHDGATGPTEFRGLTGVIDPYGWTVGGAANPTLDGPALVQFTGRMRATSLTGTDDVSVELRFSPGNLGQQVLTLDTVNEWVEFAMTFAVEDISGDFGTPKFVGIDATTVLETADIELTLTYYPDLASGVVLQGSQSPRDNFMALDGLVFAANSTGYAHKAVNMSNTGFAYVGISFNACLFVADLAGTGYGISMARSSGSTSLGTATSPVVLQNCTFHNIGIHAISLGGPGGAAPTINDYVEVLNCTFVSEKSGATSTAIGIFDCNGSLNLKVVNCLNLGLDNDSDVGQISTLALTTTGSAGNIGQQSSANYQFPGKGSPYPITASTAYDPGAGDFALYVGKNGALLDSPNNDVIDQGVGPSANSDVPTTDILGNARSGATANPGAFEQPQATATITKTIGPSGRDYATFTLAEAAVETIATAEFGSTDLMGNNGRIVFEADAGTYNESVIVQSTLITDATRNVTYKAASGSEHGGDYDSGVILYDDSAGTATVGIYDQYLTLNNLVIKKVNPGLNRTIRSNSVTNGLTIKNCYIENTGTSTQRALELRGSNILLENNVCLSLAEVFYSGFSDTGQSIKFINNTILSGDSGYWFTAGGGTIEIVNALNLNTSRDYYAAGGWSVAGSNNFGGPASNQFPASIQGSPYPITPSKSYDPGAGDFALYVGSTGELLDSPNNDVVNQGVGPASNSDVPTTDIKGNTRSGTTANPGAFEQLNSLTTVTRTIGSGRDYATFNLAAADIDNIATAAFGSTDLVANNGAIVFEADAGYYTENVYISNNIVADSIRTVTFKPAAGSEHNGKVNEGVVLIDNGAGESFLMNTAFHTIDGLSVQNSIEARQATIIRNCNISAIRRPNGISDNQTTSNGSIIENCWIEARTRCINAVNTNATLTVRNCTFHRTDQGVRINTNCPVALYNNFAHISLTSQSFGNTVPLQGSGNVTEQTTFGDLIIPVGDGLFAGNQTWTFTTDITASSTGNQAIFDLYTSKLYDVSGNDAWQILTNLSDVPSTDITGASRKATGYNPGAFEGDAAADTPPGHAFNPTPSNGGTDIATSTTLSWSEPADTITSRQIYLGTSLGSLSLVSTSTSPVSLETVLDNETTYYWRVDLTNGAGTTQGITFVFTTESAPVAFAREGESPAVEAVGDQSTLNTTWTEADGESRSRRFPTREGDVRAKIFKMTQAKSNISFIYRESLRAMIAAFNDVGHFNSEDKFVDIKCIHGNAERAIAKLKQENSIILPMISVSQTISNNDDERRRYESVLVHEKYWDEEKHRAVRILSLAPRPVNINYQVNIWCKYMADMDQILEQIRLKFNPEMNVPTEFSTLAKAFLESEEAVGSMTANDKDDRVIKKTLNITLRTYIPSPKFLVTSTGEIEEFNIEIT